MSCWENKTVDLFFVFIKNTLIIVKSQQELVGKWTYIIIYYVLYSLTVLDFGSAF